MNRNETPYANAVKVYINNIVAFANQLNKYHDNPDMVLSLTKLAEQHLTGLQGAAETWVQLRALMLFDVESVGISPNPDDKIQQFKVKE
jgi:hypothetical protein